MEFTGCDRMHCGGCAGLARWLIAACSIEVSVCASVGLLGSAPAREQPPTRPSGATNEMNRNNQDQDGAICIFHATHPPLPPASQAQHACVQRYDEGKGRRWAMARCRRVLFWCLVLPGGDCNGKNCECRAAGWLTARRRRRYFFVVGCCRRGNLCSLAHMEVACGARNAAWCALVALWRWSHLASCAVTRLVSPVL